MKQKVVALSKNEEILKWLKHYQSKNANFTEEIKSHLNEFVERVLKLNNDNLDMSKYFLAQFFRSHCKTSNGVFFKHRNSESDEILQNCQSVYLFTTPFPTNDGGKLTIIKLANGSHVDNFNQEAFFKRFLMISDMRLMEESISLKDYFLIDFDGLTKLHFFKLVNGGIWQSFIKYLKEYYPRKLGKIYIINCKFWQRNILSLCLKMTHVDKEITSNIVYHSGLKSSIDDLKLVAESVQNNLQDFNDLFTKKLILRSDWFKHQDQLLALYSAANFGEDISENPHLFDKTSNEIYTYKNLEGIFRNIEIS